VRVGTAGPSDPLLIITARTRKRRLGGNRAALENFVVGGLGSRKHPIGFGQKIRRTVDDSTEAA
jgi:hypothetical protein